MDGGPPLAHLGDFTSCFKTWLKATSRRKLLPAPPLQVSAQGLQSLPSHHPCPKHTVIPSCWPDLLTSLCSWGTGVWGNRCRAWRPAPHPIPRLLSFPVVLGSPEPARHSTKGGGRGCFSGASIVSFWKMGAKAPGPEDTSWWEFSFFFLPPLTEDTGPVCPLSPAEVVLGSAPPSSPVKQD